MCLLAGDLPPQGESSVSMAVLALGLLELMSRLVNILIDQWGGGLGWLVILARTIALGMLGLCLM